MAGMAGPSGRWRLEEWIDLEAELAERPEVLGEEKRAVREAVAGLGEAEARGVGMRVWWGMRCGESVEGPGWRLGQALGWVVAGLVFLAFLAGGSAVLGLWDRVRGGVHVGLVLVVVIGVQWVFLLGAVLALGLRGRRGGLGMLPGLMARLARRFSGGDGWGFWSALVDGAAGRRMLGWRLVRGTQVAAMAFNVGVLAMLGGLVLGRHVGFFWETTTDVAMRETLEAVVRWLSLPWAGWLPEAVPGAAVIGETRWVPGRTETLEAGPAEWWRFLLMATVVWGFLPRLVLWGWAWRAERRAGVGVEFQSRAHRALWRGLREVSMEPVSEAAADGVLVLEVGGAVFDREGLRPFLLRRLRVNPRVWLPVAVMDAEQEAEARAALAKAPAGVVLLAEAWALSPPRMAALHAAVRERAGAGMPVKFLAANVGEGGRAVAPSVEELREWERFVDGLRDPAAEVFGFVTEV